MLETDEGGLFIGRDATRVIETARRHGVNIWKVNGAGGEGGSVTIVGGESSGRAHEMLAEIESAGPLFRRAPVRLSREGSRVWAQTLEAGPRGGVKFAPA